MKTYRIFSNDRSRNLYSCLCEIGAHNSIEAVESAKRQHPPLVQSWGIEIYVAILWPAQGADLTWVERHVQKGPKSGS